MKRYRSVFLLLVMMISLFGCSSSPRPGESDTVGEVGTSELDFEVEEHQITVNLYDGIAGYRLSEGSLSTFLGTYDHIGYFFGYREDCDRYAVCRTYEDSGIADTLCLLPDCKIVYYSGMLGDSLYFLTSTVGDAFYSTLWKINLEGKITEKKAVASERAPMVYSVQDSIVISVMTASGCETQIYNTERDEWSEVCSTEIEINEDGTMTGTYPMFGGGLLDSGFYYEMIELHGEYLDTAENSVICFYDFNTGESVEVLRPERKSLFLTGDERFIFSCEYEYHYPLGDPLMVYDLLSGEKIRLKISGLYSGRELNSLERIGDGQYRGENGYNLFDIDMRTGKISEYTIWVDLGEGSKQQGASPWWITEEKIGFRVNGEWYVIDVKDYV